MDLTPFVDSLRRELAAAAETGGDETRELAERLAVALESGIRLALLEALSAAAQEITRELAPASVELRLRGRDVSFAVNSADGTPFQAPTAASSIPSVAPLASDADERGTSRITLRVPEQLKPRIEEAANHEGLSANAWLVRAVAGALQDSAAGGRSDSHSSGWTGSNIGQQYKGWVR